MEMIDLERVRGWKDEVRMKNREISSERAKEVSPANPLCDRSGKGGALLAAGGFTSPVLIQYGDPGDGIPFDRILDIFDLHLVADERGSRIHKGLIAAPEY